MVKRSTGFSNSPTVRSQSTSRKLSAFVGRDAELRRLTLTVDLAAEGQGRVVFLSGEPGIGKTRLAREVLAVAKRRGFTVLEGHAYPLESGLAYGPFLDAFSPLLRGLDSRRLEVLTGGLPDLGRFFGGLRLPEPTPIGDPAMEKSRLFEAVSRLLERLARQSPVALMIDDVHWADLASLELLHYVARSLSSQKALLLASYRLGALETVPGLRSLVISLQQGGLAEEIVMPRLGLDAVEELAKGVLGGEVPDGLLSLLKARAGETPLFIEALIAALIDSGDLVLADHGWTLNAEGATILPPSVRHLILDRLDRLAQGDRHVLDLIAIMGNGALHAFVRTASGLEERNLIEAIQRLQATGLVSESVDGSEVAYNITHPLIQEVAYAELPEAARQHAHLMAIKAVASYSGDGMGDPPVLPIGGFGQAMKRLPLHYLGAGPEAHRESALAALVAAGERAFSAYANEEAARHYAAALTMAREICRYRGAQDGGRGPGILPDDILPWLLERLGEAQDRIGEREAAIAAWNEALTERDRTGDTIGASRLRRLLALAEWNRGHFDDSRAHLRAGLESLAGCGPCQELADLHVARFYVFGNLGDANGMAETAAELLALAGQLPSPRAKAEAYLVASYSFTWQNDVTNARERALHALMIAEQAQELAICCRAHAALVWIGMRLGDHQFMRHHAEQGLEVAGRLGAPTMGVLFRLYLALANFMSGAWKESVRNGKEAIVLARRVGHPRDLTVSLALWAMILSLQGELSQAAACIAEVRLTFPNPSGDGQLDKFISCLIDIAETALALERDQIERALGIAKGFVHLSPTAGTLARLAAPSMPIGLMLLAEAQVAGGDAEGALETARKIAGLGPTPTRYFVALASRAEGLARLALGQWEEASLCLSRAYELFAALELPFEAGKALMEQATVALSSDSPEQRKIAAKAAQKSLAMFERLEAQVYSERALRLLQRFGFSPVPSSRRRLGGIAVSERELEIARLVAEGLAMAEIAKRLSISPRTVGSHLHRIYTRLGITSRAALTRLVIESGLLSLETEIAS